MQYKVLNFELFNEYVGFLGSKTIHKEDKLKEMEKTLNELAQDGWRVHQMSTNQLHDGLPKPEDTYAYNVLVIMEKE